MSPRSKQNRKLVSPPVLKGFKPIGLPYSDTSVIAILYEEYEALRLADYSGLKQEEAARLMNVSRPTFTRIYSSCLKKIARAFTEGSSIVIEGGDVEFDRQWYRCTDCTIVFHHPGEGSAECLNCGSSRTEHINQQVLAWRKERAAPVAGSEQEGFCTCPHCGYETPHRAGVPCFSITCPDCRTTLIRKSEKK